MLEYVPVEQTAQTDDPAKKIFIFGPNMTFAADSNENTVHLYFTACCSASPISLE